MNPRDAQGEARLVLAIIVAKFRRDAYLIAKVGGCCRSVHGRFQWIRANNGVKIVGNDWRRAA